MKISALIVGNEPLFGNALEKLLLRFCPGVTIKGIVHGTDDFFATIDQHNIDVLFLDINVGNTCNGLELQDKLCKYDFGVVLISAYSEHAMKAFAYGAVHYLMEATDYDLLLATMRRMKRRKEATAADTRQESGSQSNTWLAAPSKIALSDMYTTQFVSLDDIAYLESNGSYTVFHLRDKQRYTKSRNLKYFEGALEEHTLFVRVHKSFVVNKTHIKAYRKSNQQLELFNGAAVPITIGYRALVAHLGNHLIS